jgi:hypothetical protein
MRPVHNPNIWGNRIFAWAVVHITDSASPYYREEGRILAVLVAKYKYSTEIPDSYDVVFADGHSATFWNAQMEMKPT